MPKQYSPLLYCRNMATSLETSCDLYTCAVCLENMIDNSPRILACVHTFCLKCLETLPLTGSNIKCPTCRQETKIPNEDVNQLPVNFMMKQMKEHMQRLLRNKESLCHLCATAIAKQKCKDCTHLLCDSCIDKHNAWSQFQNHTLVPVCCKHPEGISSHICMNCLEAVCTLCILNDHSDHQTIVKASKGVACLQKTVEGWTKEAEYKLSQAQKKQQNIEKNLLLSHELKAKVATIVAESMCQYHEATEILLNIDSHEKNIQGALICKGSDIKEYQNLLTSLSNVQFETVVELLEEFKVLSREANKKLYKDDAKDEIPPFSMASTLFDLSEGGKHIKTRRELESEIKYLMKTVSDLESENKTLKKSNHSLRRKRAKYKEMEQR